jgi:hypothetical protein
MVVIFKEYSVKFVHIIADGETLIAGVSRSHPRRQPRPPPPGYATDRYAMFSNRFGRQLNADLCRSNLNSHAENTSFR